MSGTFVVAVGGRGVVRNDREVLIVDIKEDVARALNHHASLRSLRDVGHGKRIGARIRHFEGQRDWVGEAPIHRKQNIDIWRIDGAAICSRDVPCDGF